MQYDQMAGSPGKYYAPAKEIGYLSGPMSDGTYFQGLLTSLPGSWMGATSGIYYDENGSRFGLFLGSLSGSYNGATGLLTASGGFARTPFLMSTGAAHTGTLYNGLLGYFPGLSSLTVGAAGPVSITAGAATFVPRRDVGTTTLDFLLPQRGDRKSVV